METEINKIKSEYISTKIPEHLELNGIEDLLSRIEGTSPKSQVYFFKPIFIVGMLFVIFLIGLGGTAAFSTPSSPLYSVKKLGEKIAETALLKTPFGTQNALQNFERKHSIVPTPKALQTITPTLTPTPTKTHGTESKKDIHPSENKESDKKELERNNPEVKGVSTHSEDKSSNSQGDKINSTSSEHPSNQSDSHSQNETEHEDQSSHQNENGSNNSGKDK